MARQQVSPGYPPLLWSNMDEAFSKINANFTELYATVGGGSVVDFSQLETDVTPNDDDTYTLGDETHRWKQVYVAGWEDSEGSQFNGLWLENAQIKGIGSTVELPSNSTVGGDLIIDPNKTFFKSVQVDNGNQIVANEFIDVLNLNSGTAMQLVVDSAAESVTINNAGVTSLSGSTGISVSSATGSITLTNTGVQSVTNSAVLPSGRTVGAGIASDLSTGAITLTNTGILDVQGGFGITVNVDPATGIANVVNTQPAQAAFQRIRLFGDTLGVNDVVADTTTDQLTLESGNGIIITTTPATDTITVSFDPNTDVTGSIFANDSTQLIDSIDGIIFAQYLQGTATIDVVGDVTGNTTGYHTGDVTGSVFADDSTKLVDAVESKIVGNVDTSVVETNLITSQGGNLNATGATLIVGAANGTAQGGTTLVGGGVGTAGNGGSLSLFGGPGSAGNGGAVFISSGAGTGGDSGDISIIAAAGTVNGGDVYIGGGNGGSGTDGSVIFVGNVDFNNAGIVGLKGDLTGSVFADDSTALVDGVDGKIFAQYLEGTATIDIIGSVFGDDSTMLVNGVDGTLAYYPTTASDWDGDAPTTVGEALDRLATLIKTLNAGTGA